MLRCVYILATGHKGTLYIGVTSDIVKQVWQHKNRLSEGFDSKYSVDQFESHQTMESAIRREKAMKKWNREWELKLIEVSNADWKDLFRGFLG